MANTTISPNMNLPIPVVGVDPGPDWASNINASLTLVDQHNHAPGNGVQINPSGININAAFSMNGNSVTNIGALTLIIQSAAAANNSIYNNAGNLYFVDNLGNNIQITKNGTVAGSSGTITGLPSGTASASYAAGTFVFQSATSTAANIDAGSYIYRNNTANSFGLTLQPPTGLSSNYVLTLPPVNSSGATQVMVLSTVGNMSSISYDAVGQNMTSVGANAIAASRTRSTGAASELTPGGIPFSATSGSFTTISTSYVTVTPLNVQLTTSGRPVCIKIQPDSINFSALFATGGAIASCQILNVTNTAAWQYFLEGNIAVPSSMSTIDTSVSGLPGTYSWEVQLRSSNGSTVGLSNAILIAYEL